MSDYEWASRAAKLEFNAVETVRKSAESWRNGLAGLTAVIVGATIVKGPAEFQKLDDAAQTTVVVSFVVTVVLLVLAAYLAMRASFGVPTRIVNDGDSLKEWTASESNKARLYLWWARVLTPVALLALVVGIVASWTSEAPKPVSTVTVVLDNGDTICGEPSGSVGGVIVITDSANTSVQAPVDQIVSMVFGTCPR